MWSPNLLVLVCLFLLVGTGTPFSVHASPQMFFAGSMVVVTCRVPPQPENRLLKVGIYNEQSSEYDLHGNASPVTWRVEFKKVGCDAVAAYCEVRRNDGTQGRVVIPLVVAGCDL